MSFSQSQVYNMPWTVTKIVFLFFLVYAEASSNSSSHSCSYSNTKLIHIAFMTAYSGSFVSSGAIPAVKLAIERVNNDSSLLQGYKLNYSKILNTECNRVTSLDVFFKMVEDVPPYPLAILGMGCAVATDPVAEINNNWRLPMMGYVAAAPSLSERDRFKSYYRTYPSDAIFVPTVLSFIRYFNWRTLLIITENANTFITNDRMLKNILPGVGVNVSSESFTFILDESDSNIERQIADIVRNREEDPHIIFVNTFETKARVILCMFYRLGVTTKHYVFITHGWYQTGWWSEKIAKFPLNCSDTEMINMLPGVIAVQQFPISRNGSLATASGLSADEFDHMYRARLAEYPNLLYQLEATNAFDAVWALALAMDNASQSLCSGDIGYCSNTRVTENIPLENYTFYNDRIECLLNRSLNNMEFEGVSGYVQFDENGTRVQNDVYIQQYRREHNSLSRVVIGVIHSHKNNTFNYVSNETSSSVWPDGIPPDGIPLNVFNGVHFVITVAYCASATVGIFFAIFCLFFNIGFRKKRVVKLTSPALNYFIVTGAIMLYVSVIGHSLNGTSDTINNLKCYVGNTLRILGYTTAFSAVLAKICRVYYIFHNPSLNKKLVRDWHLLLLSSAVVTVSIVLLIIENIVPVFSPHPLATSDRERGTTINERNVTVHNHVYTCGRLTITQNGIEITAFIYVLIIQIVGIVLAFQTRKVKVKILNDSKWIAAIIYSSSLCVVVVILSEFTLAGFIDAKTALLNGSVLITTTVFLTMVFVPKMIWLYKDPTGSNIFYGNSNTNTSQRRPSTVDRKLSLLAFGLGSTPQEMSQTAILESKVKELETELAMRKNCIHCHNENTEKILSKNVGFVLPDCNDMQNEQSQIDGNNTTNIQ